MGNRNNAADASADVHGVPDIQIRATSPQERGTGLFGRAREASRQGQELRRQRQGVERRRKLLGDAVRSRDDSAMVVIAPYKMRNSNPAGLRAVGRKSS